MNFMRVMDRYDLPPERKRAIVTLVRWKRWRQFLRRHGLPVPAFMLPEPDLSQTVDWLMRTESPPNP